MVVKKLANNSDPAFEVNAPAGESLCFLARDVAIKPPV